MAKTEKLQLTELITPFLHNLDAMMESLHPLMMMAWVVNKSASKEHREALEKYGTSTEETDEYTKFDVPFEHARRVSKKRRRHSRAKRAFSYLPRLMLVSFVNEYDAFLRRLISDLHQHEATLLKASERSLTISELMAFDNFDDAQEFLIECEVETVMRKSHLEHFKWMEKRFGIELRKGLDRLPIFVELTERRNLFVHSDGVVSSQYMKVCGQNGVDLSHAHVGETLEANQEYLIEAYYCLYEFAVKLSQVLSRKLFPKRLEDIDEVLQTITYELLTEDKFVLATRLLSFAVDILPRHSSEVNRRIFLINLAQALKFSGNDTSAQKRLDAEDWTACGINFKICVQVLKDDFTSACDTMREIGAAGSIKRQDFLEWPLFRELRRQEIFRQTFKEIFGTEPVLEDVHEEPDESEKPALNVAKGNDGTGGRK